LKTRPVIIIAFSVCCLLFSLSFSQAPSITLEKYYKLQDSSYVYFSSCVETSTGDFIVAGSINANRESDGLIMKISKTGDVVWTYRDTTWYHDWLVKISENSINELMAIGGYYDTIKQEIAVFSLFLDSNGRIIKSYAIDTLGFYWIDSKTGNDGFTLLGITPDTLLTTIKIKSNGDKQVLLQTVLPQNLRDFSHQQFFTRDGGYLLAEIDTASEANNLLRIAKLNATGSVLWNKKYFFHSLNTRLPIINSDIIENLNGKFAIPVACGTETAILIVSPDGDSLTMRMEDMIFLHSIIATSDSCFIVLMSPVSIDASELSREFIMNKFNDKGDTVWSYYDYRDRMGGQQIMELSTGEILTVGTANYSSSTFRDGWLVKMSAGNPVRRNRQCIPMVIAQLNNKYSKTGLFNLLGRKVGGMSSPTGLFCRNKPLVCHNEKGIPIKRIVVK
jgi:hypothetical protein